MLSNPYMEKPVLAPNLTERTFILHNQPMKQLHINVYTLLQLFPWIRPFFSILVNFANLHRDAYNKEVIKGISYRN